MMTMVNHPAAIADFMTENSTSFNAKLAQAERSYLVDEYGDMDEEDLELVDPMELLQSTFDDIDMSGKKNLEWISAYLSVLGTEIVMDVETAPEGEYFYD